MRHLALVLATLTLTATAAFAYVQPGHLPQTGLASENTTLEAAENGQGALTPLPQIVTAEPLPGRPIGRGRGGPTNPVPEPGTVMLASMGLIALGAALRRRRP